MQAVQGLHHITVYAKDPQKNVDFYHTVLGQRWVKKTVNFDDPSLYHLYYGDEIGSPGTIMTFFPVENAARGTAGNGEATAVAYTIRPDSLPYWQARLKEHNIAMGQLQTRFGATVLLFNDPDGMVVELITSTEPATIQNWANSPVPAEHALRGFHSTTLWVANHAPTGRILTEGLGYTFAGQEGARFRYAGVGNDVGLYVDLLERPDGSRGRTGAGTIHHIAFRTVDDSEQVEYQEKLGRMGMAVTPVRDRQYFHSIYFREPNGVLFEIATDAPGFTYDEPIAELGKSLKLPDWYEPHRATIENALTPIVHPDDLRETK